MDPKERSEIFRERFLDEAKARDIWLPPNYYSDKQVTLQGRIMDAIYHKDKHCIAIRLHLPDGTSRVGYLNAQDFTWHGRKFDRVPADEVDKTMLDWVKMLKKHADLGHNLKLTLYEAQV